MKELFKKYCLLFVLVILPIFAYAEENVPAKPTHMPPILTTTAV